MQYFWELLENYSILYQNTTQKLTKIVLKNRILGTNKLFSWSYIKRPKVIRPNLQNIDFKKLKNSKDENSLSRKKNAIVFFSNILSLRNQLIPLSGRKGSSLSYISSNCKKLPSESFGHLNFVWKRRLFLKYSIKFFDISSISALWSRPLAFWPSI